MTFDLYVWKSPREVDAERAEVLLKTWHEDGGGLSESAFEPSTDVGWFYRELLRDMPRIEAASDIAPNRSTAPILLSATDEPPARVVGLRVSPGAPSAELETIFGLAAKYDLVLFDKRSGRVHLPLEAMAAHASATFWPAGAIRAAVAGGVGGVIAVVAWFHWDPVPQPAPHVDRRVRVRGSGLHVHPRGPKGGKSAQVRIASGTRWPMSRATARADADRGRRRGCCARSCPRYAITATCCRGVGTARLNTT